jgi:hypothetical protein
MQRRTDSPDLGWPQGQSLIKGYGVATVLGRMCNRAVEVLELPLQVLELPLQHKQKALGEALDHGGQQSSCYVLTCVSTAGWIWGIHYGEYIMGH